MNAFFDERCLNHPDLSRVLRSWRQIADFTKARTTGLTLLLDKNAVHEGPFLQRLNTIRDGERVLYLPILFGSERVLDWRESAISGDSICRVATEHVLVSDCAICEVYEHRKAVTETAIVGHTSSSYVGLHSVGIEKSEPQEALLEVVCGTASVDIQRIAGLWGCLLPQYGANVSRPPQDAETVLGQDPVRFARVGRFERNGRRNVYREVQTNRLFYVDNLHHGAAAHLEVFDAQERHLGTASLDGTLDVSTRVLGRTILW